MIQTLAFGDVARGSEHPLQPPVPIVEGRRIVGDHGFLAVPGARCQLVVGDFLFAQHELDARLGQLRIGEVVLERRANQLVTHAPGQRLHLLVDVCDDARRVSRHDCVDVLDPARGFENESFEPRRNRSSELEAERGGARDHFLRIGDVGRGDLVQDMSTGDTTQTIQVSNTGTFWVHVDNGICNGDDTVNVTFSTIPQINLGNDTTLCNGQVLTLDAGYAGYSYLWSTSGTAQTITVATTGTYWLIMTNGICTVSDSINVNVITLLPVSLGPDTSICAGIVINLQSSNPNANHLWSNGDTTVAINASTQGTYWLLDNIGNCIAADTMNIIYLQSPTVNTGNDTSLCGTDELTVQATATGAVSYLWNDGDVNSVKVISSQGIFWVEVTSANGCTARDTLVLNGYGCEFYLFVPNVFTPNGDHNNETFFPLGYNVVSGDMQIWDRWGELLYSTNDLTKGWDGTFKGNECPINAYVWVINYSGIAEDGSLQTKVKVGTVTLLR